MQIEGKPRTIGTLLKPRREKAAPAQHPDLSYIGLEHVEAHTSKLLGSVPATEMRSTANRFYTGDVLYSRLRPYLNKVWHADRDGLCSSEFIVLPGNDEIDANFLRYRLNSRDFVSFANSLNAGDRPRVDFDQISSFCLPNFSLGAQRAAVAEIEKQFTRLEAGVTALRRVQANLKRYRAAVLKAACEGQLVPTEAELQESAGKSQQEFESGEQLLKRILAERRLRWAGRGKYKEPAAPNITKLPLLPPGWAWATWGQIGMSQNGRPFKSAEYQRNGFKLLRPGNLHASGAVIWTDDNTRSMPPERANENRDLIVRGGELVMNLTAQSLKDEFLGRVCLTSDGEECLLNQRLARLTPIIVSPEFILFLMKARPFRRFVDGLNSGSLIQHMFTSQLAEFTFALPPLVEQTRIIAEVERRFSVIDRIEGALAIQLRRASKLRQSVLHRAFSAGLL